MLSYTEIKPGKIIIIDDTPFSVLWTSGVVKKQRQKPHNTAKLKNLITGNVIEKTFTQSDKIPEADLDTEEIRYLYTNPRTGESIFCDPENPADRFVVNHSVLENKLPYMLENAVFTALVFNGEILDIKLNDKINLKVIEAPPNIKGNTSAGGSKVVVTETGLKVNVPLFIKEGDVIRVNTSTGEYSERV